MKMTSLALALSIPFIFAVSGCKSSSSQSSAAPPPPAAGADGQPATPAPASGDQPTDTSAPTNP